MIYFKALYFKNKNIIVEIIIFDFEIAAKN